MNGTSATPNVVIVGRPNVGKSALFNRLIRRRTAIVHDQPGITRDRISAVCTSGIFPFTVWDTGGIGGAGEAELTKQVRSVADEAVREGDLLLFMVDAQQGLTPIDRELARVLRKSGKPLLLVVNKIDDPKHEALSDDFAALGFEKTLSVSAAHGRGIADLLDEIQEALAPIRRDQDTTAVTESKPPVALAIIGRPNVGKSSLINAITRSKRAIVSELPGTTRDAVDISYRRDNDHFVFIDTAGIRKRGRHSSSVEVFSVMRSERSIRRADVCVLISDVTTGITTQDKKIAGQIQEARKAAIVILNKFDLIKKKRTSVRVIENVVEEARHQLFFLEYAPVLVASALTGDQIEKLFRLLKKIQRAAQRRIGTGVLNRALRAAFDANPPPMVSGKRLKLFYAAQASGSNSGLRAPEFVLFVNEPRLLSDPYRRYLEARVREVEPYIGLPVILTCRPRSETRKS
jgi:GTPase